MNSGAPDTFTLGKYIRMETEVESLLMEDEGFPRNRIVKPWLKNTGRFDEHFKLKIYFQSE